MLSTFIIAITATVMLHTAAAASVPTQEVCTLLGQEKLDAFFKQSLLNEQPHSTFFKRIRNNGDIIISEAPFCISDKVPTIFNGVCAGYGPDQVRVLNVAQQCAILQTDNTPLPQPKKSMGNRWDALKHAVAVYKSLMCGSVDVLADQLTTHLFNCESFDDESNSVTDEDLEQVKNMGKAVVKEILITHLSALRKDVYSSLFNLVPSDILPELEPKEERLKFINNFCFLRKHCKTQQNSRTGYMSELLKKIQSARFCGKLKNVKCGEMVSAFDTRLKGLKFTWNTEQDFANNDLRLLEIEKEAVETVENCLKLREGEAVAVEKKAPVVNIVTSKDPALSEISDAKKALVEKGASKANKVSKANKASQTTTMATAAELVGKKNKKKLKTAAATPSNLANRRQGKAQSN